MEVPRNFFQILQGYFSFTYSQINLKIKVVNQYLQSGIIWLGGESTTPLDFWRADFDLFRRLVDGIFWEVGQKDKVQEDWTYLKREITKA